MEDTINVLRNKFDSELIFFALIFADRQKCKNDVLNLKLSKSYCVTDSYQVLLEYVDDQGATDGNQSLNTANCEIVLESLFV